MTVWVFLCLLRLYTVCKTLEMYPDITLIKSKEQYDDIIQHNPPLLLFSPTFVKGESYRGEDVRLMCFRVIFHFSNAQTPAGSLYLLAGCKHKQGFFFFYIPWC